MNLSVLLCILCYFNRNGFISGDLNPEIPINTPTDPEYVYSLTQGMHCPLEVRLYMWLLRIIGFGLRVDYSVMI